jgi:integrase
MPYKGLGVLKTKIDDPAIRKWADSLKPKSRTKLHAFLKFWQWAKKRTEKHKQTGKQKTVGFWNSAQEMLSDHTRRLRSGDPDQQFRHLEIAKEYVRGKGTSPSDRRIAMSAVRAFYRFYKRPLQDLDTSELEDIYEPTAADSKRSIELSRTLTPAEVAMLVRAAKMPYRAVLAVMFQAAMDFSAFEQFNRDLWRRADCFDPSALSRPGPVMIGGLIRSKTVGRRVARGGAISVYYTFIGEDAKTQLNEWMGKRREMLQKAGQADSDFLFFNWRRGGRQSFRSSLVPVTGNTIGKMVTSLIKKLDLVKEPEEKSPGTRYYIHGHEFRDCFKSLCTPAGVNKVASEFFLGHPIDRLGYDKSPQTDVAFFRGEYRKVEPGLNIVSNLRGVPGEDEAMRLARREFNRLSLLTGNWKEKELPKLGDLADITSERLRELLREKASTATDEGGLNRNNGRRQKVVPMADVARWIEDGWDFVQELPNGQAVIRSFA